MQVDRESQDDLMRSICCTGKVFGEPMKLTFVSKAEWLSLPDELKPWALKEESGEWYAIITLNQAQTSFPSS